MVPITKTQVYARSDGKNTIGYAHITLGDTFVVKNLRIVKGKKGIFVGMPSNKTKRGDFVDIFFPISQEARIYLTETVIEAFRQEYPELVGEARVYGVDTDFNHDDEKEAAN
ncbi:MAG: SpoVG family protein [Leptospiraceae bacterium]|nr:SpoVG family protein [Leptospiraceae bacterium]